ncbi:hypothetical protein ACFPPD_22015 [Cohnella suwonensis]|uniref:ABC transporter permease n=1 Tax=Cohnella suwonensis TaxID=696072 RepID=A0ABW0M361_9BACL
MTTLSRLAHFEFSRFSSSLPGLTSRGIKIAISYLALIIAGGIYFFRENNSPEIVFAFGVTLSWGILMSLSMSHIMTFWAQPQREWWLSLPHSRSLLVSAKALGLMRVGLRVVILIQLACLCYYGVAAASGRMNPLPAGQLIAIVGANLVISLSFIPVAVLLGLSICTMYNGWARWGLIPYLIIMQSPYGLFGILMEMKSSEFRAISPDYLLLYSLGIVVIGWPIAYVLMRLISGIGMKNMADVRLRIKSTASSRSTGKNKDDLIRSANKLSGFAILYSLERERFRYYGSIKSIRMVKYAILSLIALGGFLSSAYSTALLEMMQILFMLPVLGASVYMMNKGNIERKNLQWWLSFPLPRSHLVLAQIAGLWMTVVRIIGALSAAYGFGIAMGIVTGRMGMQHLMEHIEWFAYTLVLYISMLTIALGMLQSSYYFMKSTLLTYIHLPLYMLVGFQTVIINEFFFPKNFVTPAQVPYWDYVGILLAIGLPIAALSTWIGAKYMQVLLNIQSKSTNQR